MNCVITKPTMWFCDQFRNKLVYNKRWLETGNYKKEEELYYPCSKNKGADQLCVIAELICAFVFTYACCLLLYAVAQLLCKKVIPL